MDRQTPSQYVIVLKPQNVALHADAGTSLMEVLHSIQAGDGDPGSVLPGSTTTLEGVFHTPCGGRGICGKCRVQVNTYPLPEITDADRKWISAADLARGFRLACMIRIGADMEITLPDYSNSHRILASSGNLPDVIEPFVRKLCIDIPEGSIEDQRSEIERLVAGCEEVTGIPDWIMAPDLLPGMAETLAQSGRTFTVVAAGRKITWVEPGDTTPDSFGFAVDLGTTTLVVYLLDVSTGELLGTAAELNSQGRFGADVISRIGYAIDDGNGVMNGLNRLCGTITAQLTSMMVSLAARCGISQDAVYHCVVAGNTTMLHLLEQVSPAGIARYPYIPVFTGMQQHYSLTTGDVQGGENFSKEFPRCMVTLLPGISSYIGADIVAGIETIHMADEESLTLLVDIGTNGEIVLGSNRGLTACATAAGPAFEGYHISCGTGGIEGAVSEVFIEDGDIAFRTIGDKPAIGICGSGIIDLTAVLLRLGVIDKRGRITAPGDLPANVPETIRNRIRDGANGGKGARKAGGSRVFILHEAGRDDEGKSVVFTQQDIREVQLAKAAVAAGIEILLEKTGCGVEEVKRVCIAGGFGTYIRKESALAVGLMPAAWADRITGSGNTAGWGAVRSLLSAASMDRCRRIVGNCRYVELSTEQQFNKKLMKHMYLPEVKAGRK